MLAERAFYCLKRVDRSKRQNIIALTYKVSGFKEEEQMSNVYTSADQLIGRTPLLELTHIEKAEGLKAHIYGKLEYFLILQAL